MDTVAAVCGHSFSLNIAPGGVMIAPGWLFSGGFPPESMAQAIGEEGNIG